MQLGKIKGKYNLSYWEKSTFFDSIDVAIVGSGIVGLSAAIALKEKNPPLKVIVIERGPLPIGASTRNAGFACFGSVTEIMDDLSHNDDDEVWTVVENRFKGLNQLRKRFGDRLMGYQNLGGFELFRAEEKQIHESCLEAIPHYNKMLKSITGLSQTYVPADKMITSFGFKGIANLIHNQQEGQINTGWLMQCMLKYAQRIGVEIYNGVKVKDFQPQNNGILVSDKRLEYFLPIR